MTFVMYYANNHNPYVINELTGKSHKLISDIFIFYRTYLSVIGQRKDRVVLNFRGASNKPKGVVSLSF